MAPQVYARMIQTLGAEAPETDVFASQDIIVDRARWAPVPERNKKIGKIRRKNFLNS